MKDKFINFRATEKEKKQLEMLAKKAKLSQADFIRHSIFNKEIIVIDGLKELQKELKRIGNNLNQLTTRANMGQFQTVSLDITKDQLAQIHDRLTELCIAKEKLSPAGAENNSEAEILIDTAKAESQTEEVSSEFDIEKQYFTVKEEVNNGQIIHQTNELFEVLENDPTEPIVLSPPQTKLGQRRGNSIFRDILGKKAD